MAGKHSAPTALARRLWRWGFPELTGHGRFVSANAVDALGNGLLLAFQVIYFVQTTSVPLTSVGAALTLAQVLALPSAMLVGPVLDRAGARAVAATGNIVSAIGFSGFLLVQSTWHIVVVALVTQVGATLYWTSSSALVVLAAKDGERTRWFGFIRALRNIGNGAGGGLAVAAVGLGGVTGLRGIVLANVVTFLVAGLLIITWRPPQAVALADVAAEGLPDSARQVSYSHVLRDSRYMRLVGVNFSFVYAAMVLSVLLAAYITEALREGAWLAGTLLMVNTGLVATAQTFISGKLERWRATRVIVGASLLNAAAFGLFAALGLVPSGVAVLGLFVAIVIYTISEMLATPPVNDLSVSMAPDHARGRYLAVYQLSWTIGGASAPWLLTSLLAAGAAWPWIFLLALSLLAVPVVLSLELRSRQQARHRAPRPTRKDLVVAVATVVLGTPRRRGANRRPRGRGATAMPEAVDRAA